MRRALRALLALYLLASLAVSVAATIDPSERIICHRAPLLLAVAHVVTVGDGYGMMDSKGYWGQTDRAPGTRLLLLELYSPLSNAEDATVASFRIEF